MVKWFKEKYRIIKAFVLLKIAATLFRGILWAAKVKRDLADSIADFYNEVVYWAIDIIRVLEGAAK